MSCECEVVPQDDSASIDIKITDVSFHASFEAMRQLLEKTDHVSHATRTTPTHQSDVLMEGWCPHTKVARDLLCEL